MAIVAACIAAQVGCDRQVVRATPEQAAWIEQPISRLAPGLPPATVEALLRERFERSDSVYGQRGSASSTKLLHSFTVEREGSLMQGFWMPWFDGGFVFRDGALDKVVPPPPSGSSWCTRADGRVAREWMSVPVRDAALFAMNAPAVDPQELSATLAARHLMPVVEHHGEFNAIFLPLIPLEPIVALTNPGGEMEAARFDASVRRFPTVQLRPGDAIDTVESALGPPLTECTRPGGELIRIHGDPAVVVPSIRVEVEFRGGRVHSLFCTYWCRCKEQQDPCEYPPRTLETSEPPRP